jgi:hypothetical protein
MKPIAWYDPTNGMVSTDNDCPLFTPLGQVLPLYLKEGQEPVAIYRAGQTKGEVYHVQFLKEMAADEVLLYDAPVQRKSLTDEEILLISADCAATHQHTDIHFARAIEAKLKEKNT